MSAPGSLLSVAAFLYAQTTPPSRSAGISKPVFRKEANTLDSPLPGTVRGKWKSCKLRSCPDWCPDSVQISPARLWIGIRHPRCQVVLVEPRTRGRSALAQELRKPGGNAGEQSSEVFRYLHWPGKNVVLNRDVGVVAVRRHGVVIRDLHSARRGVDGFEPRKPAQVLWAIVMSCGILVGSSKALPMIGPVPPWLEAASVIQLVVSMSSARLS